MSIDTDDAAYRFVHEAKLKEARNLSKRITRQERRKKQSPWWAFFSFVLTAYVGSTIAQRGDTVMAVTLALLSAWYLFLAYTQWKQSRALG